jgi:hypothetical protein
MVYLSAIMKIFAIVFAILTACFVAWDIARRIRPDVIPSVIPDTQCVGMFGALILAALADIADWWKWYYEQKIKSQEAITSQPDSSRQD